MANTKATRSSAAVSRIAFVGVMAALVFAASKLAIPFLGSKVHFGNTLCILSGLLFGPLTGALAAGIGSGFTDLLSGYGPQDILITFVSKFAMAAVAGGIMRTIRDGKQVRRSVTAVIASVVGAWTYVGLYMLKHLILRGVVEQVGWDATVAVLASKFPASAINAVFAMVCAPLLYHALRPALLHMPAYRKLRVGEPAGNRTETSMDSNT